MNSIFVSILFMCVISGFAIIGGNEETGFDFFTGNELFQDSVTKYHALQYQPRHVHISYGNSPSEMTITWSTIDSTNSSVVEYGLEGGNRKSGKLFQQKAIGYSKQFTETGSMKLTQYIHRVTLYNLTASQLYVYHCGSELGWSDIYFFTAMNDDPDWTPSLCIFGDLGNGNAQSLTRIQRESQQGMYDAILHVGDFAYDLDFEDGMIGDSFMDQIQPVAAYIPYMTVPGNHEFRGNFTQYKSRFTMPGGNDSMMYSFNMGPIHFIGFSTEFYYFIQYGIKQIAAQYEWIEQDLKEATKPENRKKQPWIITYAHRPMYCSNNDFDDCTRFETLVRVGIPYFHWFGLEDMFMKYGVDLSIWAHEHDYERLWPVYNHTVYNGSLEEPYTNPRALVHVTTGSAGCSEKHDGFIPEIPVWSAFRSLDYGYSRLKILNRTALYFEQVSDDQGGKVIDSFTLVRDTHGPYDYPNPKLMLDW